MAHCYNILTFILILPVLLALKQDLESKSKDLTNYEHEFEDGSHFTNTWAVEFNPELSHDEITSFAQKHGFIHYGEIIEDSHHHDFHHPRVAKQSQDHAAEYTKLLTDHIHVRSVEQQIAKRRVKRSHAVEPHVTLNDPFWSKTWYLNRGIDSRTSFDMNVIPAWLNGYTGKNIVVTILDDGIERTHPDLERNYHAAASTDINSKDSDPMPRYDYTNENRHGTRCAGEVAAVANNSRCSVGVAYDAKIGGIRMLDGSVTDSVEAASLGFNPQVVDIYSSSWGPDDNGRTVDGPGKLAKQAFIDGVERGRNGKGNIFMWASGNGGSHSDSCSCDGYTNSIYTLSVSSASQGNTPPWYLEQCASTLASTYSSGATGREKQIVTTDLRKLCTTTHTGTSASAPLAAGLVAVMLEANPKLTWRDVQYVTLKAANPEPLLSHGEFKTNGVGRKYSHKFGYGLMDCAKMTEVAKDWRTAPPQLIKHLPKMSPDSDLRGTYTKTVTVPSCASGDNGCIRHLEHVQLVLSISSSRRGRLSVKLTSPKGTVSTVLPPRNSDSTSAGFSQWPFMSVHFWGEDPAGNWKFEVINGGQSGRISFYQLVLYGVAVDAFDKNRPEVQSEIHCHPTCNQTLSTSKACSGSGADQCKECRSDLFKVDDTNMCVGSCVKGYYQDKRTCKGCYKLCKDCIGGNINQCTSCINDFFLDHNGHCVEKCPDGYFADESTGECAQCKDECERCSSLEKCDKCDEGYDVHNGDCLEKCKDRQYRNKDGVCKECEDEKCSVCSEADKCDACKPPAKRYHYRCEDECPSNTYSAKIDRDSGQFECLDCHESCETCNEGRDNNCLTCSDPNQITPAHTCVKNTTCEINEFRLLAVERCKPCHESCFSCAGPTSNECTSCKDDSYLKDGTCVKDCGSGFYHYIDYRDNHTSCQQCHPSCLNCSAATSTSCTACIDTAQLTDENACHPICEQGKYLRKYETTNMTLDPLCGNCSSSCLTCSGPRTADCTSCRGDMALNAAGMCVEHCPDGFFKKAASSMEGTANDYYTCHSCNVQCVTCNGAMATDCLSCASDDVLFNHLCVKKVTCYENQFYNSTANECLSCHVTCMNCNGPSELECTSCGVSQDLFMPPSATTLSPVAPHVGQCVKCCKDDNVVPGQCCDCSKPGFPVCQIIEVRETTMAEQVGLDASHQRLVVVAVVGVVSAIALFGIIFSVLQYRSHGRCAWQTSSSTLFIDGGGVVEYSSLTDKDDMHHLMATNDIEGFSNHSEYHSNNGTSKMFDYNSD